MSYIFDLSNITWEHLGCITQSYMNLSYDAFLSFLELDGPLDVFGA